MSSTRWDIALRRAHLVNLEHNPTLTSSPGNYSRAERRAVLAITHSARL